MANLIDFYTQGTFEGVEGGWTYDNGLFIFVPAVRSSDFAFQGIYSGKLTSVDSGTSGFEYLLNTRIPITPGENIQASIMLRCTGGIPNGVDFCLIGNPDTGQTGFFVKVNATLAKLGWVELKINFTPTVFTDVVLSETMCNVSLIAVGNWTKFKASSPGIEEQFPQINDYIGINADEIPAGQFIYVDALSADLADPAIIPDEQLLGRKLYHVENIFWLSDGQNVYDIDEPIGWDKILLNIAFDMSTFRFKFEFTDKDVTLEFDRSSGAYDILRNIWNTDGVAGFASLKFGEKNGDVVTIHWEAQLNFSEDYQDNKYTVKMSAEKRSMQDTFRTRFDIDADLFESSTYDGRDLETLPTVNVWLHPIRQDYSATFIGNPNAPATGNIPWVQRDLEAVSAPPLKQVINSIDGLNNPLVPDGSMYYSGLNFKEGLTQKRVLVKKAKVRYKSTISSGDKAYLRIFKLSGVTQEGFSPYDTPLPSDDYKDTLVIVPGTFEHTFEILNAEFVMEPDSAIFIRVQIDGVVDNAEGNSAWLLPEIWYMEVNETETFAPTIIQAFPIHEAISRQLEIITGNVAPLKSNFFGRADIGYASDGCGSKNLLTNGLLIREIYKEYILSAKDWVNSLSSIYCLGMSVERDNDNNEWLRFEPLEYFFQDKEIFRFTIVANYRREVASEFIFNELQFGYSKFPNNNQNTSLGDWMTNKSYLTPWKSVKNKLSRLCEFILSSLYIELTREQNVRANPTGNFETDSNTFMIGYQGKTSEVTGDVQVQFFTDGNKIVIDRWDIPLAIGETFFVVDGVNVGTKTVIGMDVLIEINQCTIFTKEDLLNETLPFINFSLNSSRYVPSRDEDFRRLSMVGITPVGEEYPYYNLRHHVKRLYLRWSKFFTTSMKESQTIRFTSGLNNNSVQTILKDEASCINMDGQTKGDWYANDGGVDVDTYGSIAEPKTLSKALFGKNKIFWDAPMSWTMFNMLRKAFEGRHPDNKNYGYVSVLNPDNAYDKTFILSARFNPISQMIKFETIEKNPDA